MSRILVIDDDPLTRSTIVTMLNRADFSVEDASDGKTGLAICHTNPPDLVITDIFMPHQDGIEIIRELKHSFPQTKILAITGAGQMHREMASAAKALGADRILHKPFEKKSLLEAVNVALGTPSPPSQHGA